MTFPTVSRAQMQEIDRYMIEDLGISLPQMMENAGRALANLAIDIWAPSRVMVMAGSGGNGGGGMVAARHLQNRSVDVGVVTTRSLEALTGVPRQQADVLARMGVPLTQNIELIETNVDLVIDAVIGYSLSGPPVGAAQHAISVMKEWSGPTLSLDCPSGIDVDTGLAPGAVVVPDSTMTLALAKIGLKATNAGQLYLADISVPAAAYDRFGMSVPADLFATSQLIRL